MTKFIMNNAIKALSKRSFPWAVAQGRTGGKRLLAISPNSFPISISSQTLTPMMIPLRPRFPPLLLPQDVSPPRITISGLLMNSEEPKVAPSSNALVVANGNPQVLAYHQWARFIQLIRYLLDVYARHTAVLQDIRKIFTYEDKEAIEYYTGNEGYVQMNGFLRKDTDVTVDAAVMEDKIDGVLRAMYKLPAPVFKTVKKTGKVLNKVFRGTSLPWSIGHGMYIFRSGLPQHIRQQTQVHQA